MYLSGFTVDFLTCRLFFYLPSLPPFSILFLPLITKIRFQYAGCKQMCEVVKCIEKLLDWVFGDLGQANYALDWIQHNYEVPFFGQIRHLDESL
jgi:hypothetical protein